MGGGEGGTEGGEGQEGASWRDAEAATDDVVRRSVQADTGGLPCALRTTPHAIKAHTATHARQSGGALPHAPT